MFQNLYKSIFSKSTAKGKPDRNAYALALVQRAYTKNHLEDYSGAMVDYSKAIELDPYSAGAYVDRGVAKELLGDMNGACADWRKAASLGHSESAEWVKDQCN